DSRLNPAFDHLDGHWPFFTVSHRQACPHLRLEALAPLRHQLPWGLGVTAPPLIRGPWRLQVAHRGGALDAQHIALATLAQLVAKPRVAAQLIITRDPAVGYLIPPRVEHLQALRLARGDARVAHRRPAPPRRRCATRAAPRASSIRTAG